MTDFGDFKPEISIDFGYSSIMSSLNYVLCRDEHEKSFITSGPKFLTIGLISLSTTPNLTAAWNPFRFGVNAEYTIPWCLEIPFNTSI